MSPIYRKTAAKAWEMALKKWNTNFWENRTTGAFHSTKTSGLNFQQLPVANRATFSKISKKENNLARYTIRDIGLLYEVYFFPQVFFSIQLCSWSFSVEWFRHFGSSTVSRISGNFSGKFLYHLTLFPNFRSFGWMESALQSTLCFISAARYCFRNIDLARQVPHQFDVQPRITSTVPVCLLICHENKARLFTQKLELQYVLTSEMKDFIAPWQIMAR